MLLDRNVDMSAEECFKVPSRSRRSLGNAFETVCNKSLPFTRKLRSHASRCTHVDCNIRDVCEHKVNPRVTRSSVRRWVNSSECTNLRDADNAPLVIKPPSQSCSRNQSCIATKKVQSILRDSGESDLYHHLKILCLRNGKQLPTDCISNTSDYGTASDDSKNCSLATEKSPQLCSSENSDCESVSGVGTLLCCESPDEVEDHSEIDTEETVAIDLSCVGWDSDSEDYGAPDESWDSDAEKDYFRHLRESTEVQLIQTKDVMAIIPKVNCSSYCGEFKIHLKDKDELYRQGLCYGVHVHHISPIVSMQPHGIQFYKSFPALLVIPLSVEPQDEAWLTCLCSNTPEGQSPRWERLHKKDYMYRNGCLVIFAGHFSLFTVILEEPYPEVMKKIRCRRDGRMVLNEVPGVEVEFPRGCLDQDLDAYIRVLFDTEPLGIRVERFSHRRRALASPVIMLGPHGHQFKSSQPPVRVKLPVPDYFDILERFGSQAKLSVWQSSTREGEPMVWQRMNVELTLPEDGSPGIPVVSFPVHHFSFFKLVWDILSSSLYEAKMGMSYFYPYISFSMMCQAFMEQSAGDNRFGLEVICYRSDKRLPEATNYRHRVGASLKPKLVRPGRILIRLRSQMFEADVEAGEDKEMAKEEPDFRGRDFEKQYACKFKPDVSVERGTFGKVIVERILTGSKDPLFEFNLHKTGLESEISLPVGHERWTVFAMKELASSLQITEGNNWRKFAHYIGFTKSEIKSKLQYSADPFLTMMNMYNSRGGTPEEFIQALYAVSRDLRLKDAGFSGSNSEGDSNRSNGSQGSGSQASSSQGSAEKRPKQSMLRGYWPWGRVKNDSDSGDSQNESVKPDRKRSHPTSHKKNSGTTAAAKRRKFSDISETISSSSDESGHDSENKASNHEKTVSSEQHKNNMYKLNDKDLWRISSKIVRKDWRNLGRSLGIEEQALVNLEHSYQSIGFRECAYQMLMEWKGRKPRKCTFGELYKALQRENMGAVAKLMAKKIGGQDNEDGESS